MIPQSVASYTLRHGGKGTGTVFRVQAEVSRAGQKKSLGDEPGADVRSPTHFTCLRAFGPGAGSGTETSGWIGLWSYSPYSAACRPSSVSE